MTEAPAGRAEGKRPSAAPRREPDLVERSSTRNPDPSPALETSPAAVPAGMSWTRRILLLLTVVAAIGGLALWWRYQTLNPSTDDAYIGANVVRGASRIGGQVDSVAVVDRQRVARGELLFLLTGVVAFAMLPFVFLMHRPAPRPAPAARAAA